MLATAIADVAAAAKLSPIRAVAAAVVAIVVAAATVIHLGSDANGLAWAVVQIILVFIAWFDIQTRRVLNLVVYPLTIAALLLRVAFEQDELLGCVLTCVGTTVAFLLLNVLTRGGLGLGDVKLAGAIGMLLGVAGVTALALGTILGGAAALLMLIRGATRKTSLAYGPYLAAGAVVVILATTPATLI